MLIQLRLRFGNMPYFWGVRTIKSELVKNSFFHPKTKGKVNSDYNIRKSHGHFRKKKNKALEKGV